jgi:transposase-like protein
MARQSDKQQYWRDMVRRWQRSGQTVRAFCDEHGFSEQSFYGWRRTIAEHDQQAQTPAFVPIRVVSAAATPSALLEVVASSGRVIRVPADFDANALRRLLAILEEGQSC